MSSTYLAIYRLLPEPSAASLPRGTVLAMFGWTGLMRGQTGDDVHFADPHENGATRKIDGDGIDSSGTVARVTEIASGVK
jgi:hypothetical protein